MYAKIAGMYVKAHCATTFKDPAGMESTALRGGYVDVFDHKGFGTHKYIPADRLSDELGEPRGAGVYGSFLMGDGSHLLVTCKGPLACWSGKDDEKATWIPDLRKPEDMI